MLLTYISFWNGIVARLGETFPNIQIEDLKRGVTADTTLTTAIPGLGVAVNIADRGLLFAGIHRGFAPPRVEDVISNTGGLTELDAELSWNSEIGARTRLTDSLRLEATWFRMAYSNQVVAASLALGELTAAVVQLTRP